MKSSNTQGGSPEDPEVIEAEVVSDEPISLTAVRAAEDDAEFRKAVLTLLERLVTEVAMLRKSMASTRGQEHQRLRESFYTDNTYATQRTFPRTTPGWNARPPV